jgi:hypothetical protein
MRSHYLEYLGEFEAICKTALAREAGLYKLVGWGLLDEKIEDRKSRDFVPLNRNTTAKYRAV